MSSNTRRRIVDQCSQVQRSVARSAGTALLVRSIARLAILALSLGSIAGYSAEPRDLSQQLQQMSRDNQFTIVGIEKIGASPARTTSGTLKKQIKLLLENYNHILVGNGADGVERLIILGAKQPVPQRAAATDAGDQGSNETVLITVRENAHHLVDGVLVGVNGAEIPTRMTVDTGASLVVLPESVGKRLGYQMNELKTQEVRTANGPASARIGKLPTLRLGSIAIGDLEIAFIGDEQLGGAALLGMSALGRFQITLDDEKNQLTLRPKK